MAGINPDDFERMLDNPMFISQMNEAMNNPMFQQMMEQNPAIRDNPMARQMLRDPEMRRMMFSPQAIRQQLRMARMMGGMNGGNSFPAPGQTDNTGSTSTNTGSDAPLPQAGANPFAPPAMGQNPFAALFGQPPSTNTPSNAPQPDEFRNMMRAMGFNADGAATAPTTSGESGTGTTSPNPTPASSDFNPNDPFASIGRMMENPAFREMMQGMGGMPPPGGNPWQNIFGAAPPMSPPDNRPPEERYAEQLRQLNDMGFFEFERNVEALRRSGGSVQGAIEYLLGGGGS